MQKTVSGPATDDISATHSVVESIFSGQSDADGVNPDTELVVY